MYFWLFLTALTLFKIFITPLFPLIGDEAFYWVWGQHLDLSYIAHPPMVAYINFIVTALFGNNELAIRLAAILIVSLISLVIYQTGKELFNSKAGMIAATVFNLLPTFWGGGMFLVPQTIVFLFWSLSFYLLVLLIKKWKLEIGNWKFLWYLLGITAGLGLLSDYIMALFFVGTGLFLLVNKEQRHWLTKKEPYLALLLSLLVFSPVIIWNLKQGFAPLLYWGGKMGAPPRIGDNLLNFFGLQMLLYTPPIFITTIYLIINGFWKPRRLVSGFQKQEDNRVDSSVSLLAIFSAVVFLPFALISPIANVGGHWPATAYLPAILSSHQLKKWARNLLIFFALLVNILGFAYYLFFYPTPDEMKGQELTINKKLPQFIKESTPPNSRTHYIANDIGTFGLVSFHGKVTVHCPPGKSREMDYWGKADIKKGDNLLYFSRENNDQLLVELKPLFKQVWVDPKKRLFTKDADIPTKMVVFHCLGFRGGVLP